MLIDVNAFVGDYPWRHVPATTPEAILAAMDRVAIDEAWIGHLPSVFWRDPGEGNAGLYAIAARHPRLNPVPAIHPGLPNWEEDADAARTRGAPAVRCDPTFYGLPPAGSEMLALAARCARLDLPLVLAVRLEDLRQRHPNDRVDDLPPWAVRALIRAVPALRLLVTHADRGFVEEVHFGSTPTEAKRIWWDINWIWGPPEDHLEVLFKTVGVDRFVFGSGMPLRIPEVSVAKLDLLQLSADVRAAVEYDNARTLRGK